MNSVGIVTTIAGTSRSGNWEDYGDGGDGGPAIDAQLMFPSAIAVDSHGNVFIGGGAKVRVVSHTTGIISTYAGTGSYSNGGDGGPAIDAQLYVPQGIAIDGHGNVFIADSQNNNVRLVDGFTGIISTYAGTGQPGSGGDGGLAVNAQLWYPHGVAIDNLGNVFIIDMYNNKVRVVSKAGIITTFAGTGTRGSSGDGDLATLAAFYYPTAIAIDSMRNVYIADTNNNAIRLITNGTGIIDTYAGTGISWHTGVPLGDGGPATSALLSPSGLAVDIHGSLYVADGNAGLIRKITNSINYPTSQPSIQPSSHPSRPTLEPSTYPTVEPSIAPSIWQPKQEVRVFPGRVCHTICMILCLISFCLFSSIICRSLL